MAVPPPMDDNGLVTTMAKNVLENWDRIEMVTIVESGYRAILPLPSGDA